MVGVGRFTDPDEMVRVITSGQLDIIGCARPSIADPWLPRKIDEGRVEDICECIGCNVCISRFNLNSTIVCTQNPTAMEEYRRGWHPEKFATAPQPSSVLVVGAGPSGMECARVLALRGYTVDLCEADETLGGHLRNVVKLPGLAEWNRVVTFREPQLSRMANVKIMRGAGKVTADESWNTAPRKMVLATGARWVGDGLGASGPILCRASIRRCPGFVTPEQFLPERPSASGSSSSTATATSWPSSIAEVLADRGQEVTHRHAARDRRADDGPHPRGPQLQAPDAREGHHGARPAAGSRRSPRPTTASRSRSTTIIATGRAAPPNRPRESIRAASATRSRCWSATRSSFARRGSRTHELYSGLAARRGEWRDKGIEMVVRSGDCLAPRYLADAIFDGHRIAREFESENPGAASGDHPRAAGLGP